MKTKEELTEIAQDFKSVYFDAVSEGDISEDEVCEYLQEWYFASHGENLSDSDCIELEKIVDSLTFYNVKSWFRFIADDEHYDLLRQAIVDLSNGDINVPPRNKIGFIGCKFKASVYFADSKPYEVKLYDPNHEFSRNIELVEDEESENEESGWGCVTGITKDESKLRELGFTTRQVRELIGGSLTCDV